MVEESEGAFRSAAGRHAPDEPVPFHLGLSITAAELVAFQCNELLMHGWDMAAVTGQATAADGAAETTVAGLMPVWSRRFRSDLGEDVTFGLNPTGVPPTVWSFAGGRTTVADAERDAVCSCSTSGSAMGHLLWIGRRLTAREAGLVVSGERADLTEQFGFPRR
jgi:hypothetical protein